MFMEEHLHPTTVTAAMRILVALLSNQSILIKFKEGLSGGGWLEQTDSVLTNKIGTVLGETPVPCFQVHCWSLPESRVSARALQLTAPPLGPVNSNNNTKKPCSLPDSNSSQRWILVCENSETWLCFYCSIQSSLTSTVIAEVTNGTASVCAACPASVTMLAMQSRLWFAQ